MLSGTHLEIILLCVYVCVYNCVQNTSTFLETSIQMSLFSTRNNQLQFNQYCYLWYTHVLRTLGHSGNNEDVFYCDSLVQRISSWRSYPQWALHTTRNTDKCKLTRIGINKYHLYPTSALCTLSLHCQLYVLAH